MLVLWSYNHSGPGSHDLMDCWNITDFLFFLRQIFLFSKDNIFGLLKTIFFVLLKTIFFSFQRHYFLQIHLKDDISVVHMPFLLLIVLQK